MNDGVIYINKGANYKNDAIINRDTLRPAKKAGSTQASLDKGRKRIIFLTFQNQIQVPL